MEWTATFEAAAGWLQGDIISDNVFDIHLCMNKFECTIRNHIKLRCQALKKELERVQLTFTVVIARYDTFGNTSSQTALASDLHNGNER